MKQLKPQTWNYNGVGYSVSLFVEGGEVVGMTPVTTAAGIVVIPPKLLGDRVADITSALGVKPCNGCNKRRKILNGADSAVRRVLRGA